MPNEYNTVLAESQLEQIAAMPDAKQLILILRANAIRNIGIALFVLSFIAPPHWLGGDKFTLFGGFSAFIETPAWACRLVLPSIPPEPMANDILLFVVMMTAWAANFTVFIRFPAVVALIAVLLPWPAYIYLFSILRDFIPFYPWACGIALIHIGRLTGPKPKIEQRTMWTGF